MNNSIRMLLTGGIGAVGLALTAAVPASAISVGDCEDAGGIAVLTTTGEHTCIGGTYNGLDILFGRKGRGR